MSAQLLERLADRYEEADQAYYEHTQVCFDQRDEGLCRACPRLSGARWNAERALKANDEAYAFYKERRDARNQERFAAYCQAQNAGETDCSGCGRNCRRAL